MVMGPIIPVIRIVNEEQAKLFNCEYLGFQIIFEHRIAENMPVYMGVSRDGCTIHLSEHDVDCVPGSSIRIHTENVEAYHQELISRKYKFDTPGIEKMPWESLEMKLTDPFGNTITFATSI